MYFDTLHSSFDKVNSCNVMQMKVSIPFEQRRQSHMDNLYNTSEIAVFAGNISDCFLYFKFSRVIFFADCPLQSNSYDNTVPKASWIRSN